MSLLIILAGIPPTMVLSGTSLITTVLAPIIMLLPIFTGSIIFAPVEK